MRDLTDAWLREDVRRRIWVAMARSHPTYLLDAYHTLSTPWWPMEMEETEDVRKTLIWMKTHTDDFPFVPRHWAGTYVGEQMREDVL